MSSYDDFRRPLFGQSAMSNQAMAQMQTAAGRAYQGLTDRHYEQLMQKNRFLEELIIHKNLMERTVTIKVKPEDMKPVDRLQMETDEALKNWNK